MNGSHAFQSSDETVWAADEAIFQSVGSTTGTIEYDCKSDEPDEYVYPIIRATAKAGSSSSSFTFTNVTDGNRSVTVTTSQTITVILDCKNCRVYTGSKSGSGELIEISQLRFKDLGWRDVDNIYWPRLIPGTNILKISGDVVFEISYRSPYKKVGGWLV